MKDAQADQILVRNGAMSVQTMAMRHRLDPEQEEHLIRRLGHSEHTPPM